jgi:UDP-N-acetylglucosamine--N-acetylmuramyl-(pentapeptide) pyrophosphoryl-undecaprenol N-acetylglucosamine transferase
MRIIISGGGTGGHIYPAIAIADELKKRNSENEILFVGAEDRMEMERVPRAGYEIEGLWISGIQRKWSLKNLVVPVKIVMSMIKAGRIIKRFKPDVAIGVGGYASGPLLKVASSKKIPCLIQEQNSYAGITNRILGKYVDRICVAYENMNKFFPKEKIVHTGNPVRMDIMNVRERIETAQRFFGWGPNKKTLLIFGGSLGARTLNESVLLAESLIRKFPDVLLVWQTGKLYHEDLQKSALASLPNVQILPFIERMDLAYALADVIIARAGALTISELCVVGKPAILVPSPNVAEDHQTMNALSLVEQNAALMVKDSNARADLLPLAFELLEDDERKKELVEHISKLSKPHATSKIVDQIEQLVRNVEKT